MISTGIQAAGDQPTRTRVETLFDEAIALPKEELNLVFNQGEFLADGYTVNVLREPTPRKHAIPDPVLQLIRLGPRAIGPLAKHIVDVRPTTVVGVMGQGLLLIQKSNDANTGLLTRKAVERQEDELLGSHMINLKGPYIFRAGDLAYCLIGQITNRLHDPYSRVESEMIVQSPFWVESNQETKQYTDLASPKALLRSLKRDILHPDRYGRRGEGLRRLAFYFPAEMRNVLKTHPSLGSESIDILQRPVFCWELSTPAQAIFIFRKTGR